MSIAKFLLLYVPLLLLFMCTPLQSFVQRKCSYKKLGSHCSTQDKKWKIDNVCILDKIKGPICYSPPSVKFSFWLVVAIANDLNIPHSLWIVGTGPGLSWDRAIQMSTLKQGYWGFNINYTNDLSSHFCNNQSHCSLNQKAVEFRVYADSSKKKNMLGHNFYVRLPVSDSIVSHSDFKPPMVYFFPYFKGKKVESKKFYFEDRTHFKDRNRRIDVKLMYPPSYLHNYHKRYPVVVVFGGFHLQLAPLLESLFVHESNAEEAFVVVVDYGSPPPYCIFNPLMVIDEQSESFSGNLVWNCQNSDRTVEQCLECMKACYDLRVQSLCNLIQFRRLISDCGQEPVRCEGLGGTIVDLIENVVLPELSFKTTSRMLIDYPRERVSVIGIDGGGLLACYAALFRPLVFKNAACLSAPFHWPLRSLRTKQSREKQGIGLLLSQVAERIRVRKGFNKLYSTQKYYIDLDLHDNTYLPIVDAYNYSDWVVSKLRTIITLDPANLMYFTIVGSNRYGNSYIHLIKDGDFRLLNRIKEPLKFFLKPEGGYSATHSRMIKLSSYMFIDQNVKLEKRNIKIGSEVKAVNETPDCGKYLPRLPITVSITVFHYSVGKLL